MTSTAADRTDTVRVLVVDDHPGFIRAVRPVIDATPGFALIDTADSGAAALGRLNAVDDIDLVLLDVNMPGLSGLDVARRYADGAGSARIVLMSTTSLDELPVEAAGPTVAGFIAKDELSTAELSRVWSMVA